MRYSMFSLHMRACTCCVVLMHEVVFNMGPCCCARMYMTWSQYNHSEAEWHRKQQKQFLIQSNPSLQDNGV